jgi:hypothetical protein
MNEFEMMNSAQPLSHNYALHTKAMPREINTFSFPPTLKNKLLKGFFNGLAGKKGGRESAIFDTHCLLLTVNERLSFCGV